MIEQKIGQYTVKLKPVTHENGLAYVVDFQISQEYETGFEEVAQDTIKWDECMNWGHSNSMLLHHCRIEEVDDLAAALKWAHAEALKLTV
jgi:hypothetical protein